MTDRDHFAAAATDDQSDWLRHAVARDAITIAKLEAEIERLREAIRRLADQDATLSVCDGGVTVTMDGTLDGWIPVAERLPIERQHVLVWRAGAPWPDRAVLHNGKWQIASRSWLYTRVTHWMPFRAPPSDGK